MFHFAAKPSPKNLRKIKNPDAVAVNACC
jgi:hypothetical protein